MAFGRIWQHAEYSYGVWESLAHQANTILRSFDKSENKANKDIIF
jgi:hypothetical protein